MIDLLTDPADAIEQLPLWAQVLFAFAVSELRVGKYDPLPRSLLGRLTPVP